MVAAQRGQLDEAAGLGIAALDAGRVVASTLGWFAQLDAALRAWPTGISEVEDFHQRFILTRRSVKSGATP